MTELEKMQRGLAYDAGSAEIEQLRNNTFTLLKEANQHQFKNAIPYFRKLLKSLGENSFVCPPFLCEYGKSISVGHHTFMNMGITMLDNAPITIGHYVFIGPSVQFYTPSHPIDFKKRRTEGIQCEPITIEDDVWIGGNTVICQGVTIGARSVVTAGAVVTDNVLPDTMVGGVPAKFIKSLT